MKPVNKVLKLTVLSVIVLLVVLGAAFCFFSGHILKAGVETAVTKALGVGAHIDEAALSIIKGTVEIKGLTVNNPAGYTYKNLLELGDGRIAVKVGSLLGNTVHIKEIKLDGINLVIEQKALSNNLQEVISSISSKDRRGSEPAGKKLHIDYLEITNIKVKVKLLPVPGKADTVTLNLAPIKMSNLGSDNKLSTGILSSKIMLAIANGITKEGVDVLPEEIVNSIKSTLDRTIDLGKAASKEGGKLIDAGKDVGAELVEGLKGLLKPKKKE